MTTIVVMSDASAFSLREAGSAKQSPRSARLERMFKEHHAPVWRTLRRLGLGPESAADATQQAFVIAAERLADVREGSERAYLFGTAIRLARGMQRRAKRIDLDPEMDERAGVESRAEELVDHRRRFTLAERALSELDQELLEVFVLFELEGLTTPEIAELVGVPLGTAASRLRRAREAFRATASRLERSLRGKGAR